MEEIFSSRSKFIAKSASNSAGFKQLMSNPKVAKVINNSKEKRLFYDAIRRQALEGESKGKDIARRALGELQDKHKDAFNPNELRVLDKELTGGAGFLHDKKPDQVVVNRVAERQKRYDEIMQKRQNTGGIGYDVKKRFEMSQKEAARARGIHERQSIRELSAAGKKESKDWFNEPATLNDQQKRAIEARKMIEKIQG